jgi:hypothetical protein
VLTCRPGWYVPTSRNVVAAYLIVGYCAIDTHTRTHAHTHTRTHAQAQEQAKPSILKLTRSSPCSLTCKARHTRCDERKPVCGNCERLKLDCRPSEMITHSIWSAVDAMAAHPAHRAEPNAGPDSLFTATTTTPHRRTCRPMPWTLPRFRCLRSHPSQCPRPQDPRPRATHTLRRCSRPTPSLP